MITLSRACALVFLAVIQTVAMGAAVTKSYDDDENSFRWVIVFDAHFDGEVKRTFDPDEDFWENHSFKGYYSESENKYNFAYTGRHKWGPHKNKDIDPGSTVTLSWNLPDNLTDVPILVASDVKDHAHSPPPYHSDYYSAHMQEDEHRNWLITIDGHHRSQQAPEPASLAVFGGLVGISAALRFCRRSRAQSPPRSCV
jgi:hypothetical protein